MVKGRAIIAFSLILLCLTISSVVYLTPVKAQYQTITIRADGSISPSFAPVQQSGNIYSISSNFEGAIMVQRNSTIIDGNGHLVEGITISKVQNAIVKDFTLTGGLMGIYVYDCSNVTLTNNTISRTTNNDTLWEGHGGYLTGGIYILQGNSNRIIGNNLINNNVGLLLDNTRQNTISLNNITESTSEAIEFNLSPDNLIYRNNFINNSLPILDNGPIQHQTISKNIWNNSTVGNFWSNYNGNGSYVIDENNIDYYPLTNPVDINTQTPTPIPTATAYLPPNNRNAPHLDPIFYLIPVSVIVAIVVLSVLLYRRHRKIANLKQ